MSHGVMNRSESEVNDFEYDHGAQFFTARSDEFKKEVDVWLENKWIKKWCNGFSRNDGYPRYIGIDGMHSLPLKLSENLKVFQKTTIKTLKLLKHDWFLEGTDNINFSSKFRSAKTAIAFSVGEKSAKLLEIIFARSPKP